MILPAIHCSFLRLFAPFRGHFLESVLAVPKSREGRSILVLPWFSTSHLRKVYGRLRKAVEGCGRLRKVTPPSLHFHYSMVRDRNLSDFGIGAGDGDRTPAGRIFRALMLARPLPIIFFAEQH